MVYAALAVESGQVDDEAIDETILPGEDPSLAKGTNFGRVHVADPVFDIERPGLLPPEGQSSARSFSPVTAAASSYASGTASLILTRTQQVLLVMVSITVMSTRFCHGSARVLLSVKQLKARRWRKLFLSFNPINPEDQVVLPLAVSRMSL